MKKYKVLVLTDHTGHSDQNSIYSILSQMIGHERCEIVDVASRGLHENRFFFEAMQRDALLGTEVRPDFSFTKDGKHYKSHLKKLKPKDYTIILLRLPRPISDEFLLWLDEVFSHAIVINSPKGIIKTSNKKYLVNFPSICPDVRLCYTVEDIKAEADKYPIVLKPLKEYGGRGLIRIDGDTTDDGNKEFDTEHYLEALASDMPSEGFLAMRYLKNVSQGDKRILVVDGDIMAASLRLPGEGSWLCNVAQGGKSVTAEVTEDERAIIEHINPYLLSEGIMIYGADTLVDDNGKRILSEVNTLSIGGFPQAEAQTGIPIIKMTINKIFEYADEHE